jgi:hypothetical protein
MKFKAIASSLLFSLMVCFNDAYAQNAPPACQPGISFWSLMGVGVGYQDGTDPTTYLVDYLYGGRYTSWWIRRQGGAR